MAEPRTPKDIGEVASPFGSFSPISFFMTSAFMQYDFSAIETAAAQRDYTRAQALTLQALAEAKDKVSFVFEHTIPAHEKRHFFDLVATPFGVQLFWDSLFACASFVILLQDPRLRDEGIELPIRKWALKGDCPKEVKSFLDEYDNHRVLHDLLLRGSPTRTKRPGVPSHQDFIVGRFDDGPPQVGFRAGPDFMLYPLSGLSIMEGLAFFCQLHSAKALDPKGAVSLYDNVVSNPDQWPYWSALLAARLCCAENYNPDEIIKMLEFALMMPAPIVATTTRLRQHMTREELHPGSRFAAIATEKLGNNRRGNVESAADSVCRRMGWLRPADVVDETFRWLGQTDMPVTDMMSAVRKDYRGLAMKAFNARREDALLGFQYAELIGPVLLPPIHRKARPDGTVDIMCENNMWSGFVCITSLLEDMVNREYPRCPFSMWSEVKLPECGECICEQSRAFSGRCQAAAILKGLAVRIKPSRN